MKRLIIITMATVMLGLTVNAQQSLISQTKKAIDGQALNVGSYEKAFKILEPALTNDETRNKAETWALATRIKLEQFDKYMDSRRVGKKVNAKSMGHTLIDAYEYSLNALKLDTIHVLDKKGDPVMDKKTKQPQVKTKFSKDIVNGLVKHHDNFRLAGSELYNVKDWEGAYQAWEDYCRMAARTDDPRFIVDNNTVAEVRYYQGIAAWQKGDTIDAVRLFSIARHAGYDHKEAYDYALICLNDMGNEAEVVNLAWEAYNKFGTTDPQYIRILINYYISRYEYYEANDLIDTAISDNPDDDELQNLKGLVVENQTDIYDALPYYQRCIELNDSNAVGLFNVGRYFYNKAQETRMNSNLSGKRLAKLVNPMYEEALPYLEKSWSINPNNEELKNALRDIYYKLGEVTKLQAIEESH